MLSLDNRGSEATVLRAAPSLFSRAALGFTAGLLKLTMPASNAWNSTLEMMTFYMRFFMCLGCAVFVLCDDAEELSLITWQMWGRGLNIDLFVCYVIIIFCYY